jgi:hypothetical protein
MTAAEAPSLTRAVASLAAEAHVTGAAWLGATAALALADGSFFWRPTARTAGSPRTRTARSLLRRATASTS